MTAEEIKRLAEVPGVDEAILFDLVMRCLPPDRVREFKIAGLRTILNRPYLFMPDDDPGPDGGKHFRLVGGAA